MLHHVRRGKGPPLLLVHGLGASWRSWEPIIAPLARTRDVIAIDLPGHGNSPPEADSGTFAGQMRAVEAFIAEAGLGKVDIVGSSMGARIVLELVRRGDVGAAVALDPGGFWTPWEAKFLGTTLGGSVALLRAIRPLLPTLGGSAVGRTALMLQLSARPWALGPDLVAHELQAFAASPVFPALLRDLVDGPTQQGPAADPSRPLAIGWGRGDRVCFPRQARRAAAAFPRAELHWFEQCGHFPMWDRPEETVELIRAAVA